MIIEQIKKIMILYPVENPLIMIASPGLITNDGSIDKIIYLPLNGINLKKYIEDRLMIPCFVENDANVQALGVCNDDMDLLYMVVGTAVGGAYVSKGVIFRGHNGYAGEFGHLFVGTESTCYCGNKGCLDTVISGKIMLEVLGNMWWTNQEERVCEYMKFAGEITGRSIANLSILYNPSAVLICGRICSNSIFVNAVTQAYKNNSWYSIPLGFESETWKNVYNGACSIINKNQTIKENCYA
jgi:predicted NBD/HSP70 family sugar kinase